MWIFETALMGLPYRPHADSSRRHERSAARQSEARALLGVQWIAGLPRAGVTQTASYMPGRRECARA